MEVMVTGATGSFGQAYVKRLLSDPGIRRIVCYSRGEHQQEEMAAKFNDARLRFFIGDVRDKERLTLAMRGISTVVHAAALKVVPIAEYNPTECIATNVMGAQNVVLAALACGVKKVLGVSTDKAVNPVNLYGATKLCAEKTFIAANALSAGRTAFSVVRYGNVVGSRGSVVPLFKRLKEQGKPLTITDPEMTRFWITMDQAIDLVDLAIRTMRWNEIFIPKIPSMKVVDLADAIDPNGERMMVGIRPGEKIHECLIPEEENAYDGGDHYVILPPGLPSTKPKVERGWRYTSGTNDKWLSLDDLRKII